MPAEVRKILASHRCYYEVSPYYIIDEERPVGRAVSARRIQAGFDIDIYGVKTSPEPDPPAEYWLVYNKLQEIAEVVRHESSEDCSVEVISFGSTIILDTRDHFQPTALLRIRVTHFRDMHEPADAAVQQASKAVEAQLGSLGIAAGRGRS